MLDDGAETDLDLGHYERFIDENLHRGSNFTTGAVYSSGHREGAPRRLPGQDRAGHPAHHRRDQGTDPALAETEAADLVVVEIGGTVGDIESLPFLEAVRQLRNEIGRDNCAFVHVSPDAVHRAVRRAEDQADAALGQGAAFARPAARRDRLPLRPPDRPQPQGEDLAALRRADQRRDLRRSTRRRSTRCRWCSARRGSTPSSRATCGSTPSRTSRSGRRSSSGSTRATEPVTIAVVGKYVNLRDAYLSRDGGAEARRVPPRRRRADRVGRLGRPRRVRHRGGARRRRRHPDPRRVRRARRRGQGRGDPLRARARGAVPGHLPRAAVRGDRVRAATSADSRVRTPASSTRPRRIR